MDIICKMYTVHTHCAYIYTYNIERDINIYQYFYFTFLRKNHTVNNLWRITFSP